MIFPHFLCFCAFVCPLIYSFFLLLLLLFFFIFVPTAACVLSHHRRQCHNGRWRWVGPVSAPLLSVDGHQSYVKVNRLDVMSDGCHKYGRIIAPLFLTVLTIRRVYLCQSSAKAARLNPKPCVEASDGRPTS